MMLLPQVSDGYLFGCVMILLWDFVSSFTLELELVWRAPNTFTKFIFLWNRYFALAVGLLGISYWIALLKVDGSTLCRAITLTPSMFAMVGLTAHLILGVQLTTLYRNKPIIRHIMFLLIALNFGVEVFISTEIMIGHVFSSDIGNECFQDTASSKVMWGFISPLILHLIFFAMTACKAWAHRQSTLGLLSHSIDRPILHYHFIFTIAITMIYSLSIAMVLQPTPSAYKLMHFFPALIFTQIFLGKMYLGIKNANRRARLYAALGDGLRPLDLPADQAWVVVDADLTSKIFPLSTFDPIPLEKLASGAHLREYFQDYEFKSRLSSMFVPYQGNNILPKQRLSEYRHTEIFSHEPEEYTHGSYNRNSFATRGSAADRHVQDYDARIGKTSDIIPHRAVKIYVRPSHRLRSKTLSSIGLPTPGNSLRSASAASNPAKSNPLNNYLTTRSPSMSTSLTNRPSTTHFLTITPTTTTSHASTGKIFSKKPSLTEFEAILEEA